MKRERKVVAITGGYKGIGGALSELLAQSGYALVIGGRYKQELQQFEERIKAITDVEVIVMDVRKKEDCSRFVQAAIGRFGKLDILVNNAGMLGKKSGMENIPEEELRATFETNVYGPFFCTQEAVRIMKKQGFGHILNIGSDSAVYHTSSNLAYGASKSALIGFTGTLRNELSGTGIRVTCFNPTGTKTTIFQHWQPERNIESFMDPHVVARKIVEHIESAPTSEEWNVVVR